MRNSYANFIFPFYRLIYINYYRDVLTRLSFRSRYLFSFSVYLKYILSSSPLLNRAYITLFYSCPSRALCPNHQKPLKSFRGRPDKYKVLKDFFIPENFLLLKLSIFIVNYIVELTKMNTRAKRKNIEC
jgi:hypothetical protein